MNKETENLDISVIIPTYNRPARLGQCLQSIAHLDYPRDRFEVIVVDDGSKTSLKPIIEPFKSQITLRLIRQNNAGPANARNTGAAAAKGRYLVFTDDDCQPHSDWLTALKDKLQQQPNALVGGYTVNALTENIFSSASQLLIDYLYDYYNGHQQPSFFASNNFAMAKEQFRQLGGFDTSFPLAAGEDREFCDRWLHHGFHLVYAPSAKVNHTHHLSLRRFWLQHFNYGRGAYCFHEVRAHRTSKMVKVEPLQFYWQLLTYPLTGRFHGLVLATLLLLSQIANAAGFFWELGQKRWSPSTQSVNSEI